MQQFEFLDTDAYLNFASDPERTDQTFKIQQTLVKHPNRNEMIKWTSKACLENPEFMELYNKKYIPEFPTIEELQSCPEGSLGKALAKHLTDNNIALDFSGLDTSIFYRQDTNHINYLAIRTIRNHDVFHVVLNLTTSPMHEFCLFNVQLAQFRSPYHMILNSCGYLNCAFNEPENIPDFLDQTNHYYQVGRKIRFIAGFPFEEHWRTDLNEVRSMLRIKPEDIFL